MALRIIFMGTPDFAVPTLLALAGAGHEIVAVYTQPPRKAGRRGLEETKTPVHKVAEQLGFEVLTPVSLRHEADQTVFRAHDADVAVVVAYGLLLPTPILEDTRLGCFNGHASALPRWRGAAPIQRALMAGDRETAMMIMKMDKGLDTGDVALTETVPIDPAMTAGELHDVLAGRSADLMVRAMAALERGSLTLTPQAGEGVTYARKIDKAEARIGWSEPAETVHNLIRGLSSFPGAWCEMPLGGKMERVKILRSAVAEGRGQPGTVLTDDFVIACGDGAIRLLVLQKAGGKPLAASDFMRGNPVATGTVLS